MNMTLIQGENSHPQDFCKSNIFNIVSTFYLKYVLCPQGIFYNFGVWSDFFKVLQTS